MNGLVWYYVVIDGMCEVIEPVLVDFILVKCIYAI